MRWFCQDRYGGSVCGGGLGNSKLCANIIIAASFREITADGYLASYKSSKRWHATLMCQYLLIFKKKIQQFENTLERKRKKYTMIKNLWQHK